MQKKKKAREKMLQTGLKEDEEKYREQRRKTQTTVRKAKREHKERELREIEERYRKKEIRNFYQGIKNTRRGPQKPGMMFCKGKDGKLIGEEQKMVGRWKEHFQEMLNTGEGETEQEEWGNVQPNRMEIECPTKQEVRKIIKNLKNGKSPGENDIHAELIKYGGEGIEEKLYKLIRKIWQEETMPDAWKRAQLLFQYIKKEKELDAITIEE